MNHGLPVLRCEACWVLASAALALGEYCAYSCRAYAFLAPTVAVLALFAALLGHGFAVRGWPFVCLFLAGSAVASFNLDRCRTSSAALQAHVSAHAFSEELLVARAAEVRVSPRFGDCVVWQGAWRGLPLRVVGTLPAGTALPREGERWHVSGRLNLSGQTGSRVSGTVWCFSPQDRMAFVAPPPAWRRFRFRVRRALRARLWRVFPPRPRVRALLGALLLGERLPPDDRQVFLRAGVLHVFAISGLHIVALAKGVSYLARAFFLPRRLSILATGPFLLLYMLAIDARASAWRAVLMTLLAEVGRLLHRRPDNIVAWAVAFLTLHLVCPQGIEDPGSTLSFTVMLALVVGARFVAMHGVLCVSCVAWWAGTPVTARLFGHIAPGGLALSPLAVPLVSLTVVLAFAALGCGFFAPPLASWLGAAVELLLETLSALAALVAALPGASLDIAAWPRARCFLWYLCGLALVHAVMRGRRRNRL